MNSNRQRGLGALGWVSSDLHCHTALHWAAQVLFGLSWLMVIVTFPFSLCVLLKVMLQQEWLPGSRTSGDLSLTVGLATRHQNDWIVVCETQIRGFVPTGERSSGLRGWRPRLRNQTEFIVCPAKARLEFQGIYYLVPAAVGEHLFRFLEKFGNFVLTLSRHPGLEIGNILIGHFPSLPTMKILVICIEQLISEQFRQFYWKLPVREKFCNFSSRNFLLQKRLDKFFVLYVKSEANDYTI